MSLESLPLYEALLEARIRKAKRRLKLCLLWFLLACLLTFGPLAFMWALVKFFPGG